VDNDGDNKEEVDADGDHEELDDADDADDEEVGADDDNEEVDEDEDDGDNEEDVDNDSNNDTEGQVNDDDNESDHDNGAQPDDDEEEEHNYPSDWETTVDANGRPRPMSTWGMNKYINIGTVPTTACAEKHTTKEKIIAIRSNSIPIPHTPASALDDDGEFKWPTTGRIISFPNWVQVGPWYTTACELIINHPSSQHKVESVRNRSETAVAQRKIVGHIHTILPDFAC
jgi:hypothetical protein